MTFTNYLKEQLADFVDSYRKYFRETLGVAITFTSISFVIVALLFRFSEFDPSVISKHVSFLSYFFHRYSKGYTYSIIDLTKTVFIFFVSLYSLGLLRSPGNDPESKERPFKHFFRLIKSKDILFLTMTFIVSSVIDFILFKVDSFSALNTKNKNADIYIHDTCFHLRIYLPLILFALAIRSSTAFERTKLTIKRIFILYISLWLFNEFANEISLWVRSHLFGLILMPFDNPQTYYLIESIIGIPLIAFYFPGYFSAMTTSLKLTERQ